MYFLIFTGRVNTICKKNDNDVLRQIHPERGSGKAKVTNGMRLVEILAATCPRRGRHIKTRRAPGIFRDPDKTGNNFRLQQRGHMGPGAGRRQFAEESENRPRGSKKACMSGCAADEKSIFIVNDALEEPLTGQISVAA